MEHQLNTVNEESLNTGVKVHEGKTNFKTNIDTTDNIRKKTHTGAEVEKVSNYKYLEQTIAMDNRRKQEISI